LIQSRLKENQKKLPYIQLRAERTPASKITWSAFITLQLLDVYSTTRGIKYNCVREQNPLLPKKPTVEEMVLLKAGVLIPTYTAANKAATITDLDLLSPILLTGAVVINNFNIERRAKRNCIKIG
jgi:hypothetical protein